LSGGLAHHDVSLENVVKVSHHSRQVMIIDMGMCLRVPPAITASTTIHLSPQPCRGKKSYVSPEVYREEANDPFAADIWGAGVCLYMLLTGRQLYTCPEDKAFQLMAAGKTRRVVDMYEEYGLILPREAKDLVCSMLNGDPTKRPTLEEVLSHPFIRRSGSGSGGNPTLRLPTIKHLGSLGGESSASTTVLPPISTRGGNAHTSTSSTAARFEATCRHGGRGVQ